MSASQPCVLLVEDEMLLAMLVEDILGDAGYAVVKAARVPRALALLDSGTHIDAAVLDINVSGSQVFPVAERLRADGIPFVFASGYGEGGLPIDFRGHQVLQKPYLAPTLINAVASLLR
jgi:CheY-like chemotaxis protein